MTAPTARVPKPETLRKMKPLTVRAALEEGLLALSARAGADARREALYLLAGILGLTTGRAGLEREAVLNANQLAEYRSRLVRRARGEPLQYIEGRAAFRQLELRVSPAVLIPRPETEQLVECVLDWARGETGLSAVDLGTGSGAIAISLAVEQPFEMVVGVDISAAALNLARENAFTAGAADRLDLRHGSLFAALSPGERFHVVVSNPPYVALGESQSLPEEVRAWEPELALYAGVTGIEVIEQIVAGAPGYLYDGGLLALEVAPELAAQTVGLLRERGEYREARIVRDLAGRERIVLAEHRGP
jgi:release factor glutamine methyltransferase